MSAPRTNSSADAATAQSAAAIEQHFVTFYSPGTFIAETTAKPVKSWDVDAAVSMARDIHERHGASPYGFRFTARGRGPDDLDSRQTAQSCFYWLGGKVETVEEVAARNDPSERILLGNMQGNGWDRIVTNTNSWKWTQPLHDGDVVLDFDPRATGAA